MQQAVSRVASRWYYRSFLLTEAQRQEQAGKGEAPWVPHLKAWQGEDAIDTLIEVRLSCPFILLHWDLCFVVYCASECCGCSVHEGLCIISSLMRIVLYSIGL